MGCCGGGGGGVYRPPMPGTVTGVAGPSQPGTIYRVTTPQGVVHDEPDRWRAEQILAMRGGSLDIVEPGQGES